MNHVPLLKACWLLVWTAIGWLLGHVLNEPGYYAALGLGFAVISILTWPLVLPGSVQDWMEE